MRRCICHWSVRQALSRSQALFINWRLLLAHATYCKTVLCMFHTEGPLIRFGCFIGFLQCNSLSVCHVHQKKRWGDRNPSRYVLQSFLCHLVLQIQNMLVRRVQIKPFQQSLCLNWSPTRSKLSSYVSHRNKVASVVEDVLLCDEMSRGEVMGPLVWAWPGCDLLLGWPWSAAGNAVGNAGSLSYLWWDVSFEPLVFSVWQANTRSMTRSLVASTTSPDATLDIFSFVSLHHSIFL